jgi:hypothetical protein
MSDFIHDNQITLNEVFIPSHHIAFNQCNDEFNIFSATKPRKNNDLKFNNPLKKCVNDTF